MTTTVDEIDLNNVIPALRRGGANYIEFYDHAGAIKKSITEVERDVRVSEQALARLGLLSRARIGIAGSTSYQWLIADLACLARGFLTVPLDPELDWDKAQLASSLELDLILTNRADYAQAGNRTLSFESICGGTAGTEELAQSSWEADEPFTVTFTSGTSGKPKGILVRKRCFDDQFSNALGMFPIDTSDTMLVFLPLHIYLERCFIYLSILRGFNVVYAPPRFITKALKNAGFTFTVGVPQFFSSLRDLFLAQMQASPRTRLRYRLRLLLHRIGLAGLLTGPFAPLQEFLGGRARFFLTGSAPCPLPVLQFFHTMGIPLYEGYGMSEIAGMVALNSPGNVKLGSVGKVFPNKEVSLAPDGQILVRGVNAANTRYWLASEEENAATFLPDGWVATGDVGHFDRNGFLTISGRIKDVIVLSSGQKVQPGPIEAQLNNIAGVDCSVVLGSERPYLVALISAKDPQFGESTAAEALRNINQSKPDNEKVKRFHVLHDRFTVENGLLNGSLKINRKAVNASYSDLIQRLYES